MPELAEVFYYAKQWDAGKDKRITALDIRSRTRVFRATDTGALSEGLAGAQLRSTRTHGKQMLFEFSKVGLVAERPDLFFPEKNTRFQKFLLRTEKDDPCVDEFLALDVWNDAYDRVLKQVIFWLHWLH